MKAEAWEYADRRGAWVRGDVWFADGGGSDEMEPLEGAAELEEAWSDVEYDD